MILIAFYGFFKILLEERISILRRRRRRRILFIGGEGKYPQGKGGGGYL